MYIAVIPFSHSFSLEPFTYFVDPLWQKSICLGCLIEMPFGKGVDQGIVVHIFEGDSIAIETIRSIDRVIASVPLLAPYQIYMIGLISRRYLLPIHRILRMFLPAPLMQRLDKKNYIFSGDSPHIHDAVDHIPIRNILHFRDSVFDHDMFTSYIQSGSVYIVPDDFFLFSLCSDIGAEGICSGESTPTKKSRFWIETYEGKHEIIVGTRRLLYYNLTQYQHIYYIEDAFGDEDYQYPTRIRNLDIVRALADASSLGITCITTSPTLELFAKFRDFKIETQ